MKKISLVFVMLTLFISCGERYSDSTGMDFEGTWTLSESYVGGKSVDIHRGKFLTARKFEGENLLLFYSGGHYDSSFFFRLQNNNLYVRRVLDSVDVVYSYYLTDSDGNALLDSSGNKIYKDTIIRESQKPLHPEANYSPEKYYGTYSFDEGAQPTMTISRYYVDRDGAPTTDLLYGRDIYIRPDEIE
jgi:hypothetical protein